MKNLVVQSTNFSPAVELNATNGTLNFSGISMPLDVVEFYTPVLNWVNQFINISPKNTLVIFRFNYINTASVKLLFDLMVQLKKGLHEGFDLSICWYYNQPNDDIFKLGKDFAEALDCPIQLIQETNPS